MTGYTDGQRLRPAGKINVFKEQIDKLRPPFTENTIQEITKECIYIASRENVTVKV